VQKVLGLRKENVMKCNVFTVVHTVSLRLVVLLICFRVHSLRIVQVTIVFKIMCFLCLWFRTSLIYINNCPARCNTKQSIFLQIHSTCFGCQPHPSSGLLKTVTTASGNGHIFCAAAFLQRGLTWPRWRELAAEYRRL